MRKQEKSTYVPRATGSVPTSDWDWFSSLVLARETSEEAICHRRKGGPKKTITRRVVFTLSEIATLNFWAHQEGRSYWAMARLMMSLGMDVYAGVVSERAKREMPVRLGGFIDAVVRGVVARGEKLETGDSGPYNGAPFAQSYVRHGSRLRRKKRIGDYAVAVVRSRFRGDNRGEVVWYTGRDPLIANELGKTIQKARVRDTERLRPKTFRQLELQSHELHSWIPPEIDDVCFAEKCPGTTE